MSTKLFNPTGDDTKRQIINGNPTNIINLNDVRFTWATKLYRQMRENFWIPEKNDITGDVTSYNNLTEEERRAFDGMLSYLVFLDSLQTQALPYLQHFITAPELSLCVNEQVSQETMHSASYQYIIETIIPKERRNEIYDNWRNIPELKVRCEAILKHYQDFVDKPTTWTFIKALVADFLLEGVYFMNGFNFFYNLASRQLMSGTADIIRLIQRDENTHVLLFQKLINETKEQYLTSSNDARLRRMLQEKVSRMVRDMAKEAVELEVTWSQYILGNSILGVTAKSTEDYTKYLANIRLKDIGVEPLYDQVANPYKHLERVSKEEADRKENFFESAVTTYRQSTNLDGWDDW